MTLRDIASALQAAAKAALPGGTDFVPEGVAYAPGARPYVAGHLLPAQPGNPTLGTRFYRERGTYQLTLCFPADAGLGAALDLSDTLKAALPRGRSLTAGNGTVLITNTAYVGPSQIDGDRLTLPVRLTWQADVFG